jgi:hypothetical protein
MGNIVAASAHPVNRPGDVLWIGTAAGGRLWGPATKPGQAGRGAPRPDPAGRPAMGR